MWPPSALYCFFCGCNYIFALHEYIKTQSPTACKYTFTLINPSKSCGEEMENCLWQSTQILERNIMLLCKHGSVVPHSWWNTVFYCKPQNKKETTDEWSVLMKKLSFQFLHSFFQMSFVTYLFFPSSSYFVLHFPGVPPQVVASGLRPGPDRSPQAFNGCIHNVRVNGEHQDLSYRATEGGSKVITCARNMERRERNTVF